MTRTAFVNARLLDPASGYDQTGSLLVEDGRIVDLGPELFKDGIPEGMETVECGGKVLCPGLVDTERADGIAAALAPEGESAEEYRVSMVAERAVANPMGRIAVGDDIAKMAAFLASSEADYLTGLSISVSGGTEMS